MGSIADYCYVAADPNQPGAAWAACTDKPEWIADTTKNVAAWMKEGAIIMRVPHEVAGEMLRKWVGPKKQCVQKELL